MMSKAPLIGLIFGLVAPFVGLFVGLQVSPFLANVLMFPIIAVSAMTSTPLGEMASWLWLALVVLSGMTWAGVFWTCSALCLGLSLGLKSLGSKRD